LHRQRVAAIGAVGALDSRACREMRAGLQLTASNELDGDSVVAGVAGSLACSERQRPLFEPFDAQEFVALRPFGWRRAAIPEPPIEGARRRKCAYAFAADSFGRKHPSMVCSGGG
jgi:hypothetical protein